ncbi:MAG: glycosyltransferase family 2 protein [Patescibacteria group bacterium]|nr:glycosyltransferase family 2 protein [Patescibacteria group bacterium]
MFFAVVPAFNEERNIGRVVRDLFQHGCERVIVVDDGSTDQTAATAGDAGAVVLRHLINRGQGAALETGDRFALASGAEAVVHFDADGQFNPADIALARELMREKDLDVVLGSRFLDRRSQIPFLKRRLILPVGRLVNYFFTGLLLSDAHNGFRLLTKNALAKIKITQDGMAHNSEIVAQIKKYGLKYAECPVEVTYVEYGQGLTGGLKIIRDLFLAKFLK